MPRPWLAWACTPAFATVLGAASCQSAPEVLTELEPVLQAQLSRIEGGRRLLAEAHATPWQGPAPERVVECASEPCRSDDDESSNVRRLPLEVFTDGGGEGPEWFAVPRSLLREGVDPNGRPVHEFYGPTLREILSRLVSLEHVIFVERDFVIDPWVALDREHVDTLAELSVEDDDDRSHEGAGAVYLDGHLAMTAWWYDLGAEKVRGVIRADVDHEVCENAYRPTDERVLRGDLTDAATVILQATARQQWPGAVVIGHPAARRCRNGTPAGAPEL